MSKIYTKSMVLLSLFTVSLLFSGCSTFVNISQEAPLEPSYFGGVSEATNNFSKLGKTMGDIRPIEYFNVQMLAYTPPIIALGLVDIPLSVVGDVLTAPYVYTQQNRLEKLLKKQEQQLKVLEMEEKKNLNNE